MALTPEQKSSRLFKKTLGYGETLVARDFFEEPRLGRDAILPNQIWAQADQIPSTAPSLPDEGESGVVKYFEKLELAHVPGSTDRSYYHANLIDTIPFNYSDGSYTYGLFKNDGTTVIAFGEGDWLVDTTAGLLTFYGTLPSGVNAASPPKISFYKYIGTKGVPSGSTSGFNIKDPVLLASTENISNYDVDLSGFTSIPTVIDGISGATLVDDDRILIKDQDNDVENGIYVVDDGELLRAEPIVGVGDYVFVESGATNIASSWVLNNTDASDESQIISGENTQIWVLFARSAAYTAGDGLQLVGQEFKVSESLMDVISTNTSNISDLSGDTQSLSTAVSTLSGLTDGFVDDIESLSTAISTESSVRESADDVLSTAISTETSTRASADTSLEGEITTLSTAISTESSVRASADTSLEGEISTLSTDISTEISIRESESHTYLKLSGGTMSGDINLGSNVITTTETIFNNNELVTKAYVDAVAQGLDPHAPVRVVSLTNIDTGSTSFPVNIDGVDIDDEDSVLLAGQTDKTENGIWIVSGTTWVRRPDADGQPDNEVQTGDFVFVESGLTNTSTGWVLGKTDAVDPKKIDVGVETQEWFKMASPTAYTADEQGLKLSGNQFYIDLDGSTLEQSIDGLKLSDTLSTAISTNTSDIAVLEASISNIEDDITQLSGDTQSLSTAVSVNESNITVLEASISNIEDDITQLSGDTQSLSTAISTEVSVLTSGVESLSTAVSTISGLTDDFIDDIESLSTAVDTISGITTTHTSEIESLSTAISVISGNTVDIETILSDGELLGMVAGELTGITNLQPSLSTAVSSLEIEVSTNISNITSLETIVDSLTGLTSDITSLETVVDSLTGLTSDITSLETEVSTNISNISDLSGLTSSIIEDISELSGDTQSLSTVVSTLSGLTDGFDSSISSLSTAVDTLDSTVDTLSTAISTESSTRASADTSLETAINNFSGVTESSAGSGLTYLSGDTTLNVNVDNWTIRIIDDKLTGGQQWIQHSTTSAVSMGTSGATITLDKDPITPVSAYINGIEYLVNPSDIGPAASRPFFYNEYPPSTGTEIWFDTVTAGFDIVSGTDSIVIKYLIVEDLIQ